MITMFGNKNGFVFLFEALLSILTLTLFVISYTTINTNNDYTKIINYYKVLDLCTIAIDKQLNVNELQNLIEYYLPNVDYTINNIEIKNSKKKECYSKNINIYNKNSQKEIIYLKICFS